MLSERKWVPGRQKSEKWKIKRKEKKKRGGSKLLLSWTDVERQDSGFVGLTYAIVFQKAWWRMRIRLVVISLALIG